MAERSEYTRLALYVAGCNMRAVLLSVLYFLVNLGCILGGDIYESINWVPQNPMFIGDGKVCLPGARTLKVQQQSKVTFVCPNSAMVLQKGSSAVQVSSMFENLWLLYDKTAFDKCNVTLDLKKRKLLTCNTPMKLTYSSVTFAQYTAEINGLTFDGGKRYYFIATSDGSESHINDTRGGHCSDASKNVYMKLEVYVCQRSNQTYTDPKCTSDLGVVQCPPPTGGGNPTSLPTLVITDLPDTDTDLPEKKPQVPKKEARTSEDDKELKTWKFLAIGALALAAVLIVGIVALACHTYGRKMKETISPRGDKPQDGNTCFIGADSL